MEMNTSNLKLKISDKAPDFKLPGVDGKSYSLHEFKGKSALVVVFMCNHCPYVMAYIERIKAIQSEFGIKGLEVIGINSNDQVNYPDDSFEKMIEMSKEKKLNFVYLRDEDQSAANAYGAQCTPECFVFDGERKLRYHGRIDDNYKDEKAVKVEDLRNAVDALLHKRKVSFELTPAVGCSIKWR
ncbi:MAG TPA: thioredoxin family protein [Candidatus Nanoarchaeia archaeon]|nr:thioredoxin family protein [Candidatus Nanoarchaeia archaeon]